MSARSAGLRRNALRLLVASVCVVAVAWSLRGLDPATALRAAAEADPLLLGLSALPVAVRFLVWGVKWWHVLRRRERVPYGSSLRILMAGSFVNLVTPTARLAGGFVRSALLHRRWGWPRLDAYGFTLSDQVTNVLGNLGLFATAGLLGYFVIPAGSLRNGLAAAGVAIYALLLVAVLLRAPAWSRLRTAGEMRWIVRLVPPRFRSRDAATDYREAVERLLRPVLATGSARVFVGDLLWSAASFAPICAANAIVLRALGVDASLILVSVAVLLGYFAGTLAGIGGGIGITEAALTGMFLRMGIPPESALAGAILHRTVHYALVLGWGGISLLRETRTVRPAA